MTTIPAVISPEKAVEMLAKLGIEVSERTLRAKARSKGCYRQIGRAFFFLPADIEKLMEPDECSNQRSAQRANTTSRAGRSTGGRSSGQRVSRSQAANPTQPQSASASKPKSEPVTPIPFRKKG